MYIRKIKERSRGEIGLGRLCRPARNRLVSRPVSLLPVEVGSSRCRARQGRDRQAEPQVRGTLLYGSPAESTSTRSLKGFMKSATPVTLPCTPERRKEYRPGTWRRRASNF